MSRDGLAGLLAQVVEDPGSWPRLAAITDREEFARSLVEMARDHDVDVTTEDVRDALVQRRREWLERWV